MGYTLGKLPLWRGGIEKSLKGSKGGVEKAVQVPYVVLEGSMIYTAP